MINTEVTVYLMLCSGVGGAGAAAAENGASGSETTRARKMPATQTRENSHGQQHNAGSAQGCQGTNIFI
jgi:hypothetical protein